MDTKGRTSIPSVFRAELERCSDGIPFLTPAPSCVVMYTFEEWIAIERRLAGASTMRPDLQAVRRFFLSGAVECPIDAQGRILVPPHLREHGNLGREVTLAGVGSVIEIWDKSRLDANLTKTETNIGEGELSDALARFGFR
jgi:MraZ protein